MINDGSTDNSKEIIDKYADRYSNIIAYHTENQGQSAARNIGISKAKGELVAFVDCDDHISLGMLDALYESMLRSKSDISSCAFGYEYKGNVRPRLLNLEGTYSNKKAIDYLLSSRDNESVCTKLFSSNIFKDGTVRFPEGLKHEESVFLAQCYLKVNRLSYINKALYIYVMNPSSTTQGVSPTDHDADLIETSDLAAKILSDQSYIDPASILGYQLKKRVSYLYTRVRKKSTATKETDVADWVRENFKVIMKSKRIPFLLKILSLAVRAGRWLYMPIFRLTSFLRSAV